LIKYIDLGRVSKFLDGSDGQMRYIVLNAGHLEYTPDQVKTGFIHEDCKLNFSDLTETIFANKKNVFRGDVLHYYESR